MAEAVTQETKKETALRLHREHPDWTMTRISQEMGLKHPANIQKYFPPGTFSKNKYLGNPVVAVERRNRYERAHAIYAENPNITAKEIAEQMKISVTTVINYFPSGTFKRNNRRKKSKLTIKQNPVVIRPARDQLSSETKQQPESPAVVIVKQKRFDTNIKSATVHDDSWQAGIDLDEINEKKRREQYVAGGIPVSLGNTALEAIMVKACLMVIFNNHRAHQWIHLILNNPGGCHIYLNTEQKQKFDKQLRHLSNGRYGLDDARYPEKQAEQ